jgi:uncharacterized protein (TIGR02453 family)
MPLHKSNFDFLKTLKANNDREWFAENKTLYTTQHEEMISFADEVLTLTNSHDHIETVNGKKSLYRIYRDTRFSKNKTPYKTHWGGYFKRATSKLRGGYYFHIEPGNSFVGGGFWGPDTTDLKRVRQEIAADDQGLRDVIEQEDFKMTFGSLLGEQLKSAPKGYPKDHSAIDLLRYKQYLLMHKFTDREVMNADFPVEVSNIFQQMRPFFDYMSEVLTTDVNGVSLVD